MTRTPHALVVVPALVALALGLACPPARADAPAPETESPERKAEARFQEASAAFDAGRVEEACAGFDQSLHLFATLGALLNLALCHEQQGRTATAWDEFTHAAAWASTAAQRERAEFAHQHAVRLERLLSRVALEVPAGQSVHVVIDGETMTQAPGRLPLFLDPGPHVITASAPGRASYEASIVVHASGSAETLVVRIPLLEPKVETTLPPAVVAAPPPRVSSRARRMAGWIVGGAGLASLGVGVTLGAVSLSSMSGLGHSCTGSCDPGPASTAEAVSLATLGAGVVALGVGAWLLFSPALTGTGGSSRVYLAPQVTARSEGLAVGGAW